MFILDFPTPKMLIIQLPTSNVWKNANHTIFIQFLNKNPSKIEIAPKFFFVFFFNLKSNFVLKQTFSKKKFACKLLIFCLHNVVHDAQKLDFFFRFSG